MEWTNAHEVLLCREILAVEPYTAKERSPRRGMLWESIASNLNVLEFPKFKVDKRSVRDHFNKVMAPRYKKKRSEEITASRISPEQDELDVLLEEIMERIEAANKNEEELNQAGRRQTVKDKAAAEDVRCKAMERMNETKKRRSEDSSEGKRKRRSNGSDTMAYLREKNEMEAALRKEEMEIKKKEQESEIHKQQQLKHQHQDMLQMLERQKQQQRQQMQQFQMMFAQQKQQQNQLIISLLDKVAKD